MIYIQTINNSINVSFLNCCDCWMLNCNDEYTYVNDYLTWLHWNRVQML